MTRSSKQRQVLTPARAGTSVNQSEEDKAQEGLISGGQWGLSGTGRLSLCFPGKWEPTGLSWNHSTRFPAHPAPASLLTNSRPYLIKKDL